ncbi:MAG: hypothetical protein NZ749_13635, partial [bacterium]|nr:hypothetical protein [bacterium]
MIDTLAIYEKLKDKMESAAAETIAEVIGSAFSQIQQSVTEQWFRDADERLARIERTLEQLVTVQQQHSQQIAELREATQRNTEAIAELREATQRNT